MAKLKAPLLSLGAAGAIGKSLVYFGWKGIDCVREYVIPANPKTTAQNTQRGYLKEAVEKVHATQSITANLLNDLDKSAFALLGSLQPTPRTWFNTMVKLWVDQCVAGKNAGFIGAGQVAEGSSKLTITLFNLVFNIAEPTSGKLYYGTSKTAMLTSIAATKAELLAGKEIPGLTPGTKYFVQYRPLIPADCIGSNSGIYHGTPTA